MYRRRTHYRNHRSGVGVGVQRPRKTTSTPAVPNLSPFGDNADVTYDDFIDVDQTGEEMHGLDDLEGGLDGDDGMDEDGMMEAELDAWLEEDMLNETDDMYEKDDEMDDGVGEEGAYVPGRTIVYDTFDMKGQVTDRLAMWLSAEEELSQAPDTDLYPGARMTVDAAVSSLAVVVAAHKMTDKAGQDMYDAIKPMLPDDSKFPSKFARKGLEDLFVFECCPCGHTVYVAQHSTLSSCQNARCNFKHRYMPGDARQRTPMMELHYRSVFLLICQLLSTNEFETAINCQPLDSEAGLYFDIRDGSVFKRHIKEMERAYDAEIKDRGGDAELIPINLLLTLNYDGIQLFKRRSQHFSPLIVGIQNLPPNLRTDAGAGMFSISLFSAPANSNAEAFMFDILVKELQELMWKGTHVTIKGRKYFIQARLTLQCYDTKALESVLKVQAAGSAAGCPLCGLVTG